MKTILLLTFCFAALTPSFTQDSLYYSMFWTPKTVYRKAGVRQEGIVLYQYKKGVLADSVLLQTKVYDSLGQVVRLENFRGSRLRSRYTYFYSGQTLDSMIQEERWLAATVVHKYGYDEKGNLVLHQSFNGKRRTLQYRYVYNEVNQLVQLYTKAGDGGEFLSAAYTYRPDRLIQQIDYFFERANAGENYAHIFAYANGNKTVTKFFQRQGKDNRFIDYRKTYDNRNQLMEVTNPPLREKTWRPPDMHARPEEIVESLFYLPNGLLRENQVRINDELVQVEKHYYF